jgi:AbrB family transcriptional regulator (stage V sporulation protein T)
LKATGIVRRIDDLGRIVIPIEIRRDMNIRDGDPLEIFVDKNGEVILKKYSAVGELGPFAQGLVNSLHETTGCLALLSDRDAIVAVAGGPERLYAGRRVGPAVLRAMENRETVLCGPGQAGEPGSALEPASGSGGPALTAEVIAPVVVGGDPVGAVILATTEPGVAFGELEQKLTQTAAGFLARHMQE